MSEGNRKRPATAYKRMAIGVAMAGLLGVTVSMVRAVAADAPAPNLTYAGRIETADGQPLAGAHDIQLRVRECRVRERVA